MLLESILLFIYTPTACEFTLCVQYCTERVLDKEVKILFSRSKEKKAIQNEIYIFGTMQFQYSMSSIMQID